MGSRAIVRGVHSNLGVYLHYDGYYDSVRALTQYCKLKGYRSPEADSYGIARLAQVCGNFFGGGLSVGIEYLPDSMLTAEIVESYQLNNGIYELKDWEISAHWNSDLVLAADETDPDFDYDGYLLEIDRRMPFREQLGADFIFGKEVPVKSLKIGDEVFIRSFEEIEKFKVEGIASPGTLVQGVDVGGLPYVNALKESKCIGEYLAEYLRTDTVRIAKKH